jgi:outer membrane receptor protein involved in Fe transport
VNDDIKFRGGYNRAVRAPNALDLFRPQGFGLGGSEDICANDPATGLPSATLEQCQRTGVTAAQYGTIIPNPAQQYNTLGGGNPNLNPETADTYTIGAVITPAALPGFSATIDYYNIKISGAIGSLGADDIIQTCANTGDAALCSLIHRDNAGTLWLTSAGYTETTPQNINDLYAEGIDINANYSMGLGDQGDLNFSLVGTYLLASRFSNPLTDYDCVGYYGATCGQPDSTWRHKLRVSWNTMWDTQISVNWRMVGKATNEDFSPDTDLGTSSQSLKNSWIANEADKYPAYNFFDVTIQHQVNDAIQATLGVNNILDKEPPLGPSLTSTGFSGTYDPLGRYVFLGLRANF